MSQIKSRNLHRFYHTNPIKSSVSNKLATKKQVESLQVLALKNGYTSQQFYSFINPKYRQFTIVDARQLWSHLKGMEADNE